MALQVCTKCGTAYAPAAVCPQCGANAWVDETQAEQMGLYQALNEGDHESISPDNPLGIVVQSGDGTEAGAVPADAPAAEPAASGTDGPRPVEDAAAPVATTTATPSDADIRAWAAGQGIQVGDGDLPQFVITEYNKEHSS